MTGQNTNYVCGSEVVYYWFGGTTWVICSSIYLNFVMHSVILFRAVLKNIYLILTCNCVLLNRANIYAIFMMRAQGVPF